MFSMLLLLAVTNSVLTDDNGFYVTAYINDRPIHIQIDTGATDVSVNEKEAALLHLPTGGEKATYSLADGRDQKCRVVYSKVSVGDVVEPHASISICEGNGDPLLGMSWLKYAQVSMSYGTLTISKP